MDDDDMEEFSADTADTADTPDEGVNTFGMISLADLLKLLDSDNSRLGSHSHAVDDIPEPTGSDTRGVGDEQALSTTNAQLGELYALLKGRCHSAGGEIL